jgi:phosphoglucosamine mutase
MSKYFGTDGIRGRAGSELGAELALRAASAFARQPGRAAGRGRLAQIAVGRDPRLSSPMLFHAVAAGLCQAGCDVLDLGIVPTPVVPFWLLREKLAGGVMITASHNPVPDNGIKFFGPGGSKIDEAEELAIEKLIDAPQGSGEAFGSTRGVDASEAYLAFAAKAGGKGAERQLNIVLDCAYGATSELAPEAFLRAGHRIEAINARFDGSRINVRCGATHLDQLCARVKSRGADLGLAFDGDGDRVLAVDGQGRAVSGDVIIALLATHVPVYKKGGAVVMTHMTNLGVEEALAGKGIHMHRTDVGDAKVAAMMQQQGIHLGGEQSGHIIMRDRLPSGDGILTGLALANLLRRSRRSLAELAAEYPQYPQKLTNLKVRDKQAVSKDAALRRDLSAITKKNNDVRFYIRPSGTENLLRVLTEARDKERCEAANLAVCEAIQSRDIA